MTDTTTAGPTASPVLDLSGTRPLEMFTLGLVFPGTSSKSGWNINLAGPAHPQTVALNDAFSRELLEKEKAIEFAQVNQRKWKTVAEDPGERARKNVGQVCGRILSWSPNPVFKFIQPEPIEFSVSAATTLFLRPDMSGWLIQITDYLRAEAAFMPPSEKI
jgi:hypothetical protein